MVKIKDDSNNVLETYTYGASRERLETETSTERRYYAGGGNPLVEYNETGSATTPEYRKSYIHAGSRLLSTATKASSSTETVEFHHPDRLGTKLITNAGTGGQSQQSTLPYDTELSAENSGSGSTNQKFTSFDRSASTGLDYAVNRTYSQGQGRFTQVDPIGMAAGSLGNPASTNLYAYVQNMPVDLTDPFGLTSQHDEACLLSGSEETGDAVYGRLVDGKCVSNWGPAVQVYTDWDFIWIINPPILQFFQIQDDGNTGGGHGPGPSINPAPTPGSNPPPGKSPTPAPTDEERKRQQREFDKCAARANNAARQATARNIALLEGGRIIATGGVLLTRYQARHVGHSQPSNLVAGRAINEAHAVKEIFLPLNVAYAGVVLMGYAVGQQIDVPAARQAAIDRCKAQNPLADSTWAFLRF